MRLFVILVAAVALTGCSSLPKTFANRLTCTAAGDKAVVVSMYGPLGVASYLDADDAAVVCSKPAR